MPRYFFNTRIGDELISDPEGEELRDPDRAWEVARAMIRELLKSEGTEGGLLNAVLEVTDDTGEIVLEFPFTEAILDFSDIPGTRRTSRFRVVPAARPGMTAGSYPRQALPRNATSGRSNGVSNAGYLAPVGR